MKVKPAPSTREYPPKRCTCSVACQEMFKPTGSRQIFAPGHKPVSPVPQTVVEAKVRPINGHHPNVDYKLALSSAITELTALDDKIKESQYEIEGFKSGISGLEMNIASLNQRRIIVSSAISMIESLIGEKG